MMQGKNLLQALVFLMFSTRVAAGFSMRFNFANLLYKLRICDHETNFFCSRPECCDMHHGPLFPEHICGPADSPWWAKNQDDDCVMIANAAFCGDDATCLAAAELFGGDTGYYNDVDPDSGYAYYDEDNEGDRSYIGGGSDSLNHQTTTSSANYMPYIIVGGVLTTFLMALVWRKRGTIENDELKKEFAGSDLNGAVKSRMERVQAGDDVPPVTISFEPSFVPSQSDDYIMA